MSNQLCVKWYNFQADLTSQFKTLRNEADFVDVTFACGGRLLGAHKIILSACSPYFKKLFKINPCPHPVIFMRDVEIQQLETLLEFMYSGEVNIAEAELSLFYKSAEALQIQGLPGISSLCKNIQKESPNHKPVLLSNNGIKFNNNDSQDLEKEMENPNQLDIKEENAIQEIIDINPGNELENPIQIQPLGNEGNINEECTIKIRHVDEINDIFIEDDNEFEIEGISAIINHDEGYLMSTSYEKIPDNFEPPVNVINLPTEKSQNIDKINSIEKENQILNQNIVKVQEFEKIQKTENDTINKWSFLNTLAHNELNFGISVTNVPSKIDYEIRNNFDNRINHVNKNGFENLINFSFGSTPITQPNLNELPGLSQPGTSTLNSLEKAQGKDINDKLNRQNPNIISKSRRRRESSLNLTAKGKKLKKQQAKERKRRNKNNQRMIEMNRSRSHFEARYRSRTLLRSYRRTRSRSRDNARDRIYNPQYESNESYVEDRRVILVRGIEKNASRFYLKQKFERFGEIANVTLHRDEPGFSYALISFFHGQGVRNAIEHGPKNPIFRNYEIALPSLEMMQS